MARTLKPGDRVQWNTAQGKTTGTVQKKLKHATAIKTHRVRPHRITPNIW